MKTLSKNEMRTAVESLIANGAVVKNYAKFARIQAIEAVGGEVIETILARSEERRVGKECRSRWSPYH